MSEKCKKCNHTKSGIEIIDGITKINYCGCHCCRICGFSNCHCNNDLGDTACEDIFTRDLDGNIIPGPIYRGCGTKFTMYKDGIRSRIHSPTCEAFRFIVGVRDGV